MRFPIHVRDGDISLVLDFEDFDEYHGGKAQLGAMVGWRAMERASMLLSQDALWNREELTVSARHAGPGVRDALEYVTRCFTRERFTPELSGGGAGPCGSPEDFRFTVNNGRVVVQLQLRPGHVPDSFFAAVRQCRADPESADARDELSRQKHLAADAVAEVGLVDLFDCSVTALTLTPGAGRA